MKRAINHMFAESLTAVVVLAPAPVNAQVYGWKSQDRWGWSKQTTQNGRQQACKGSRQQYNTLVSMYNKQYRFTKNENVRRAWLADIEDAKRSMERWCSG